MPTKLVDAAYPHPNTVTRYRGLIKSTLVKYQKGNVCFPIGEGFGCGSSYQIGKGRQFTLKLTLDLPPFNIELGQEFECTFTWSYTSKDYERCEPEICYQDTEVIAWKNYVRIPRWTWKYYRSSVKTKYNGRTSIEQNCIFDPKCGNPLPSTDNIEKKTMAENFGNNTSSVLIVPLSFYSNTNVESTNKKDTEPDYYDSDLTDILNYDINHIVNGELQGTNFKLGISDPRLNINWIYSNNNSQEEKKSRHMSLLSINKDDYDSEGNILLDLRNKILPIFAITSMLKITDPFAHVVLIPYDSYLEQLDSPRIEQKAKVRITDFFTSIWIEFDLSHPRVADSLKNAAFLDMKIFLSSKVSSADMKAEIITFTQRFKLLESK